MSNIVVQETFRTDRKAGFDNFCLADVWPHLIRGAFLYVLNGILTTRCCGLQLSEQKVIKLICFESDGSSTTVRRQL